MACTVHAACRAPSLAASDWMGSVAEPAVYGILYTLLAHARLQCTRQCDATLQWLAG